CREPVRSRGPRGFRAEALTVPQPWTVPVHGFVTPSAAQARLNHAVGAAFRDGSVAGDCPRAGAAPALDSTVWRKRLLSRPDSSDPNIPSVAAICVYENLVTTCVERLKGTGVHIAAVATGFPSGQYPTDLKVADAARAVELGADEVDMVIDRGAFLSGRYAKVYDEIVQVKEAVGHAHLKVILETGELGTYDNVRRASLLAMAAGADFIKTSTGKIPRAATDGPAPESTDILTLRERYGHFIGGEWIEPTETYTTISPRDEAPLAEIGQATEADVEHAVEAARAAFANGWSALPGSERA